MAKRYTKKEKAQALKRLKAGESASLVAREMNIPRSTLIGWKEGEATSARARKKNAGARTESDTPTGKPWEKDKPKEKPSKNVASMSEQAENKQNFSKASWSNIDKAQTLLSRRLSRAIDYEKEIDEIVNIILEANEEELDYKQKMTLINKLKAIRITDIRDIVVMIGTLYDKQALANDEANEKLALEQSKPFEIVVKVKK